MSGIIGKKRAVSDVATPPAGYVTQFVGADGIPAYKDETGSAVKLQLSISGTVIFLSGLKNGGTADCTSIIQAGINAAQSMLSLRTNLTQIAVELPPGTFSCSQITIPSGVWVKGNSTELIGSNPASTFLVTMSGTKPKISNCKLSSTGGGVILVQEKTWYAEIRDCMIDRCIIQALYDNGAATQCTNTVAINTVQADSVSTYTGGFQLSGSDGYFCACEVSTRGALGLSADSFRPALMVEGGNYMIDNFIAETSDIGVFLSHTCVELEMCGVRAEFNYGHGWLIDGGQGRITSCSALSNSKSGLNKYDNWHVNSAYDSRYQVTALKSISRDTVNKPNWAIYDENYSMSNFNTYIAPDCWGTSNGYFTPIPCGTAWLFANNSPIPITGSDNVHIGYGITSIRMNNTSTAAINTISGCVNGQILTIIGDGMSTIKHNTTYMINSAGVDLLLLKGVIYQYMYYNKIFTQL